MPGPEPQIVTTLTPPTDSDRLAEAEAAVRGYCRWHIAPSRDDTATFKSDGGGVWLLPSLYVTNVESVTVNGEPVTGFTFYENGVLAAPGWHDDGTSWVDYESIYPHGWPKGQAVVTFTHGHPVNDVADLFGVIRSLATRAASIGTYVQVDQVRVATDASGAPLGGVLTEAERKVLNRYRLPPRP